MPARRARTGWLRDIRDFLAVYCASFVVVSIFIA